MVVVTQGANQSKNPNQATVGSMAEINMKAIPMEIGREEKINEDILNTFDFTSIDKLDPSLTDGFKKICDKEIDIDIKMIEMDSKPEYFKEKVRFRLFCQGEESNPKNVKYEIFSNEDLFFIYYNVYNECNNRLDPINFRDLQITQKVNVEYKGVNGLIKTLIDNTISKPDKYFLN